MTRTKRRVSFNPVDQDYGMRKEMSSNERKVKQQEAEQRCDVLQLLLLSLNISSVFAVSEMSDECVCVCVCVCVSDEHT